MSAFNRNRDRDMSPDRNNRFHIDGLGLQHALGLHLVGISELSDIATHDNVSCWKPESWNTRPPNNRTANEIQQTVDGIPIRKVYITNICIDVQKQEMFYIFGRFGQIVNTFIGISKNDKFKQFAFITFLNPKDASRVLWKRKFLDFKGRNIYATAADSWHQPREGPDGKIIWTTDRKPQNKVEDESEEDLEESVASIPDEPVVNNEGLNILNDDCLLHIFSFLSYKELTKIEQVCKRWQGLSYRMWKCLHVLDYCEPTFSGMEAKTPVLEQYLKRCGESLTELDLGVRNNTFSESTVAIVAKYCPNLEVLRVSNIQVGNRSLAHLGRRCPKLTELFMEGCSKFTDKDLMSLLPKCPELSQLELSQSNDITGRFLLNIQGPLKRLRLWNCPNIQISNLIQGLQKMSASLESLSLSGFGDLRGSELAQIVSATPHLKQLALCRCLPHYDGAALGEIGRLSQLTELDLSLNNVVTDKTLTAIVEGCQSLVVVNLSGSGGSTGQLSERGLSVLSRLRKLIYLDISYMDATTDTALVNISARSSRLEHLLCRGCPDITDEGSTQIVTMCGELKLFDLSGCQQVSQDTVNAAAASVKLRTNSVPLKLIIGGTNIEVAEPIPDCPLLDVDMTDLCEEHLRPDFMNNIFFPPSDSEEEEDLDHLCCDCDFEFDDLFDPTLHSSDDSLKYGQYLDEDFNDDEYN